MHTYQALAPAEDKQTIEYVRERRAVADRNLPEDAREGLQKWNFGSTEAFRGSKIVEESFWADQRRQMGYTREAYNLAGLRSESGTPESYYNTLLSQVRLVLLDNFEGMLQGL